MKKNTDFNKKVFEYYMALYAVNDIRSTTITLVIGIADIFVLLPAFANPFQPLYMYMIVPPVAFLNLWAIWIVINPQKRQLQYTLFRGVFGIVCSVGLLVITQKFAYGMLGLQTPIYFVFSVGLYIFALNHYYKNHINKLQEPIKKSKSSKKKFGFGAVAFIGLGQLIANISLGFATQKMVEIVLMCVYSMLSFILFHFIMELHRYHYLRKHIEGGGRTHETF